MADGIFEEMRVRIVQNDFSALYRRLRDGLDPNLRNSKGETLLLYAIGDPYPPDTVEQLLKSGADVNAANKVGARVLMNAVNTEFFDRRVLLKLLERGADVNARATEGNTALMCAEASAVPILVEAGADVNVQNVFGDTALIL